MKSNKQVSWISMMLCVAALALPACGGGSAGPTTAGTAAALTNRLDDDKDGRVDEGDEGTDEDEDGKVDEAAEHEDACAEHGHHGKRREPGEAVAADESDESADEADNSDDSADEADDSDDSAEEAGEADHSGRFELDCSDIVEDNADAGASVDESADDSSN